MPPRLSPLFRAVGVLSAVFVLTVFVMVAALFSDPDLPINQWLNRYSLLLLLGEVGLLLVLGCLAMLTDPAETSANRPNSEIRVDETSTVAESSSPTSQP